MCAQYASPLYTPQIRGILEQTTDELQRSNPANPPYPYRFLDALINHSVTFSQPLRTALEHIIATTRSTSIQARPLTEPQRLQPILPLVTLINPPDTRRYLRIGRCKTFRVDAYLLARIHIEELNQAYIIIMLSCSNDPRSTVNCHVRFACEFVPVVWHVTYWNRVGFFALSEAGWREWWTHGEFVDVEGLAGGFSHITEVVYRHGVHEAGDYEFAGAHVFDFTDRGDVLCAVDTIIVIDVVLPVVKHTKETRALTNNKEIWIILQHLDCEGLILCAVALVSLDGGETTLLIDRGYPFAVSS